MLSSRLCRHIFLSLSSSSSSSSLSSEKKSIFKIQGMQKKIGFVLDLLWMRLEESFPGDGRDGYWAGCGSHPSQRQAVFLLVRLLKAPNNILPRGRQSWLATGPVVEFTLSRGRLMFLLDLLWKGLDDILSRGLLN